MTYKKSVAIIGAGPAGCMCAYFASKIFDVTVFDFAKPLHTLLYTGGGRCNLAYSEYDFKELTKFYPRGEKFLYSVFSKFSTSDTIVFFKKIGVETYTQDDLRIFPKSNSAKDVREQFLHALKNCSFKKEKVLKIGGKCGSDFLLTQFTALQGGKCIEVETNQNKYLFDKVVLAIGGHSGFSLAQNLGHTIIEPKPALTALKTKENFKSVQGVSLKNIGAEIFYGSKKFPPQLDDLIFTHEGISGPLAYKISSICAREDYNKKNPIKIKLDFINKELDLQEILNSNPKKDLKNLIAEYVPKSLAAYILEKCNLPQDLKCHQVNSKARDSILKELKKFEITAISSAKERGRHLPLVTSGGVCLDEINSKTMESKLVKNLYFCGEIIDIDGFCGGFNLQNCWSTGFIAGTSL